jgi:ADP-ribose pyrophosphatase YjhB (NUDIX family)
MNPVKYATPRAAVIAVTFRGDEVILTQRRNEPQRGSWGFLGGSIEPGESIQDATLRELRSAEVLKLIDVVEVREFDHTGRHHHFILIAMLCRFTRGDLCPGDDVTDCRWVRIPEGLADFAGALVDHGSAVAIRAHRRLTSIHVGDKQ